MKDILKQWVMQLNQLKLQGQKMVLIADIASNNEDAVGQAASQVVQISNSKDGEGFIAVSKESRKRFWLDRARTAAIAKTY